MSDLVVVMHHGRIAQIGTPRALYEAPANLFVADFLGDSNLLPAQNRELVRRRDQWRRSERRRRCAHARGALAVSAGDRVVVLIRPEDMSVTHGAGSTRTRPSLAGIVQGHQLSR